MMKDEGMGGVWMEKCGDAEGGGGWKVGICLAALPEISKI